MRRTAGKTHTLYPDVPWHKHARSSVRLPWAIRSVS